MRKSVKRISNKLTTVIIVMIVLLVLGAAVFLFVAPKNVKDKVTGFTVEIAGQTVRETATAVKLEKDKAVNVGLNTIIGTTPQKVTVKVIPCATAPDFEFKVNGAGYSFKAEKDLTKGFHFSTDKNGFQMSLNQSVGGILGQLYRGFSIVSPKLDETVDYFTLVISSERQTVRIDFHVLGATDATIIAAEDNTNGITGIILDKDEVVYV